MDKHQLLLRTRKFAIGVFELANTFPKSASGKVVTYQLLRAASSGAANYRSVNRAKSRSDFTYKLKMVLEEIDEANFWLTFAVDVHLVSKDDDQLNFLTEESEQLISIFSASIKTIETKS